MPAIDDDGFVMAESLAIKLYLARKYCDQARSRKRQVQRPLTKLETILGGSSYVLGECFTVADLNIPSVMSASRLSAISMAPFPHIVAWAKRCHERPAALAVQAMRQAGA